MHVNERTLMLTALLRIHPLHESVKAHTNGRNIVGQQQETLLGPTCCVGLHGTTTMLALALRIV